MEEYFHPTPKTVASTNSKTNDLESERLRVPRDGKGAQYETQVMKGCAGEVSTAGGSTAALQQPISLD